MKGTSKKLLAVILSVMLVISLLPAVAFGEEAEQLPFSYTVDVLGESDVTIVKNNYKYYEYDPETFEQSISDNKADVYVITVPEQSKRVTLKFSEPVLVYNYNADGTYAAGWYSDGGIVGETEKTVDIDSNNDGEVDFIQIQTPYIENVSQIKYAITFQGVTLEKESGVEIAPKELMHAIAAKLANSDFSGDQNAPWFMMDMMAYEKAFINSGIKVTSEQKQKMLDVAIERIAASDSVGEVSKYILCMVSMGFDPSNMTDSSGNALDGKAKLDSLTFNDDKTITEAAGSEWTLPYVILAYQQLRGTEETQEKLVEKALEIKDKWMKTDYGVDGISFMIPVLTKYSSNDEQVKAAIQEGITIIKDNQGENGSLGNAASDGIAIVALTTQKEPITTNLSGLMSYVSSTKDGFNPVSNSFSTEEGFRGLIAASQNSEWNEYILYDFSGQTLEPAVATRGNVVFEVTPENATVTVTDSEGNTASPTDGDYMYYFDKAGTYNYTVSCAGYNTTTGSVNISEEDLSNRVKKTETVSLTKESSSGGSSKVRVTVQILAHDGEKCENTVTYKNDPDSYYSILKKDSYTAVLEKNEGTGEDAVIEALQDSNVNYTKQSNGYFSSIGGYTEASHGSSSGWLYLVNGKSGTSSLNNVTFSKNGTITMFFTDDFMKDFGSEGWAPAPDDGKDDPSDKPDDPTDKRYYDDTVGHWAEDAINKVTERGLMNGVAERKFAPDMTLSRAMFVTMLYRLEDSPSQSAAQTALPEGASQEAASKFSDVEKDSWYEEAVAWAVANDIVKGTSETTFSPNANVTREQMAAFLSRYTESKDSPSQSAAQTALPNEESQGGLDRYLDKDQISDWALESMSWAVGQGLINGVTENQLQPKGTATRAQAATILIRFDERILQSN